MIYFIYKEGGLQQASGSQCWRLRENTEQIGGLKDLAWIQFALNGAVVKNNGTLVESSCSLVSLH